MNWKKLSEEQPTKHGFYLIDVCYGSGFEKIVYVGWWKPLNGGFIAESCYRGHEDSITHWAELPPLPKD